MNPNVFSKQLNANATEFFPSLYTKIEEECKSKQNNKNEHLNDESDPVSSSKPILEEYQAMNRLSEALSPTDESTNLKQTDEMHSPSKPELEDWETENDAEKQKKQTEVNYVSPVKNYVKENSLPISQHNDVESEDELTEKELLASGTHFKDFSDRPHLNVVFIGHVDAGKSTTCGNMLVLTGQVDQRSLEKYEKEAKEKNRESWYYAFIVDINEEERLRGKTVEVGRATFELEKTRFTILDAPGHKGFVPNMISGAAQADVGVLIISARKGEFETGFERGGQTREHALLAKTLGVSQLIVAVNKMDDPTCDWNEARYQEIEKKLLPFLKGCGYNPTKDITFVPISGLCGHNIKLHATDPSLKDYEKALWYKKDQPTLFQILDNIKPPDRDKKGPLRIPLLEGFRDQGVLAVGKIEAGTAMIRQTAVLMPKNIKVKILSIMINDEEVAYARPGENVTLKLSGVQEDQITKGCVLSSSKHPCPVATSFKGQLIIIDLLEHRPIITSGYSCVIHAHTAVDECQIVKLHEATDRTTKKKKVSPLFVRNNSILVCDIQLTTHMCLEVFEKMPQLGRFTLRDEGKTIAVGKILNIIGEI